MKTVMNKSTKLEALKDELAYCEKMVASGHRNPHWAIRVEEINKELAVKPKKKKKV